MNDIDKADKLYSEAACRGQNPKIFEATRGNAVLKALEFCRVCPVVQLCEDVVLAPYQGEKALFSGVAGGKVWIRGNDRTIAERDRAVMDWRRIERAVKGDDVRLFPQEKAVACLVATAMGMTSPEIGARLKMNPAAVRRYRTSSKISEDDYARAIKIGTRLNPHGQESKAA